MMQSVPTSTRVDAVDELVGLVPVVDVVAEDVPRVAVRGANEHEGARSAQVVEELAQVRGKTHVHPELQAVGLV